MNVIILTTGISGSSVITGFLAKSGLWTGDDTVYKDNITGKYETYENKKLVDLNDRLITEAGAEFVGKARYDADQRDRFNAMYRDVDTSSYREFISECDEHSPWIWKDPRLFLTIGFWKNLLDLQDTKIIVIHRNTYELWKSQAIKRIVYSYSYLKQSENETRQELIDYLDANGFTFMTLEYDQFTGNPDKSIERLNSFLGTRLSKNDWDDIYRPTSQWSRYKRTLLAFLIYLKNYNSRIR